VTPAERRDEDRQTERLRRSIPTPRTQAAAPLPRPPPIRPVQLASSSAVPLHQRLETSRVPSQPSQDDEGGRPPLFRPFCSARPASCARCPSASGSCKATIRGSAHA
jgi:hypothetical protein